MSVLTISQVPFSNPPTFTVHVGRITTPTPISVTSPADVPVPGRPNSSLREDLRWYLEEFLAYPYPPLTDEAARIVDTLKTWGRHSFQSLFEAGKARDAYVKLADVGLEKITLEIESDDPAVLAWPWEALEDEERGTLGHQCAVIRRLRQAAEPPPLLEYPQDAVNVLLITSRPYEGDVKFGAIARPLVELVQEKQLPAHVTVLRPPTIEALTEHLAVNRGRYHIVHFDGHGGFGNDGARSANLFRGPVGKLIFEDDSGDAHAIEADTLTDLLREHRIPIVVLNACQSAMTDGAEEPFASVAAALIKAGVRSVVAMAYSLYVTGAQQFLPAFYTTLFRTGSVREAVRGGRKQMVTKPDRGLHELEDWVVPVLYEHAETYALSFARSADAPPEAAPLPAGAEAGASPHGLVGRDETLLRLERALRTRTPAIVLSAMAGMGKTTLAHGFLAWLGQTDGMDNSVWIRFDLGFRTAEYVLDRMFERIVGFPPGPEPFDAKLAFLRQGLRNDRVVIVWDNFEVVVGIPENPNSATFSSEEQGRLRQIVGALRGTRAKILITSRRDEPWLDVDRLPISLPPLNAEDRQILATRILTDLGLRVPKDDPAFGRLLVALGGHPLSMRVVLPRLLNGTPDTVLKEFSRQLTTTGATNEAESHLLAALRLVETTIPTHLRPLLLPLRFCDRWVFPSLLLDVANKAGCSYTEADVTQFCDLLIRAGLAERNRSAFELLPTVAIYVGETQWPKLAAADADRWLSALFFVHAALCATVSKERTPSAFGFLFDFRSTLTPLMALARDLDLDAWLRMVEAVAYACKELQALAEAADLYSEAIAVCEEGAREDWLEVLSHQLGMVEQDRNHLDVAEGCYRRSLEICERRGDEIGTAVSNTQLGSLARLRNRLDEAEMWYRKSLETFERCDDEVNTANTLHLLGSVDLAREHLKDAELWYRRALAIQEKCGNDQGAAMALHQLGIVAGNRNRLDEAENWYLQSLEIKERRGDEGGMANTMHQLGMVAQDRNRLDEAEGWYRRSLEIKERRLDEGGLASTMHHLGMVAQDRNRLDEAEGWYRRSLEISERRGDAEGAARTTHQFGIVAQLRDRLDDAESLYRRSLEINERRGDWSGTIISCGQMGRLGRARQRWREAAGWFVRGLLIAFKYNSLTAERMAGEFFATVQEAPESERAEMWRIWTDAGLPMPTAESE